MTATIYLIPASLGSDKTNYFLPGLVFSIINKIDHYIVENERTARRYLIKLGIKTPVDDLQFYVLDKHTDPFEKSKFLDPARHGNNMGIISEAGTPGVADPGADIVEIAHRENIRIVPLVGPSSILLALMASGLNGQNFAFTGYLPIQKNEKTQKIKQLEIRSGKENQSQIFMETPYRNRKMLDDLLKTCLPQTRLCIATDITMDSECIKTKTIAGWKANPPDIHKRPTIFILQA